MSLAWTKRRKGEDALDRWSWAHVAAGAAIAVVGIPWWPAFALIVGFEAVEALLRRVKVDGGGLFEYESWPNIIADIVIGIGAYATIRLLTGPQDFFGEFRL